MSQTVPAPVRAPDLATEVIGYRCWDVEVSWRGTPRLCSLSAQVVWRSDDWTKAICEAGHEAPHDDCTCGIYAARSLDHLLQLNYFHATDAHARVLGEVGLAGRVKRHELGWRASKARPVRLWVSHDSWELAVALRRKYGAEIVLANPWEMG
jgi:hypothetical protein